MNEGAAVEGVRDRLASLPLFAGRSLDTLSITPLPGLTNHSFRVDDGEAAYVLRLAGRGTDAFVDRAAEAHNMALAAGLGLAPEPVAVDEAAGLLLTRFLPGARPLSVAAMTAPGPRAATARLLRRLHESTVWFQGDRDFSKTLALYRRLAADRGYSEPPAFATACEDALPLQRALAAMPPSPTPCHIDPTPGNVIAVPQPGREERLYLIDWEYASMSEPAWDLANLAGEAGFEAADRAGLLADYGTPPDGRLTWRFALHVPLLHLLAAAWARLQAAAGNTQVDFAVLAGERLAAYRRERQDDAVTVALERLGAG
jgi:thiamine kinase-like enzyme